MSCSTTLDPDHMPLLLEQRISYVYDRPVRDLRHRLVVVPREEHGSQRRSEFRVSVSDESAEVTIGNDAYVNCIVDVRVPFVTSRIDFSAWSLVSRRSDAPAIESRQLLEADHLLRPTPLTRADAVLTEVARDLTASTRHPVAIGEKTCEWGTGER